MSAECPVREAQLILRSLHWHEKGTSYPTYLPVDLVSQIAESENRSLTPVEKVTLYALELMEKGFLGDTVSDRIVHV